MSNLSKQNIKLIQFLITLFIITLVSSLNLLAKHQKPLNLKQIEKEINNLINNQNFQHTLIGIKVISLDKKVNIYEKNSKVLFHPASNMKLLTTATALNCLDENFHFKTTVTADEKFEDGVLNGNLYIKGFGDPLLTNVDLDSLAERIRRYGIKQISGNIIGDVSYFDTNYWGQGWMWDDEPEPYAPFISPLIIDGGTVKLIVSPATLQNEKTNVNIELLPTFFSFSNNSITVDTLPPNPIKVTRLYHNNHFVIEGIMQINQSPDTFNLSVWEPTKFLLAVLKEKLTKRNITVRGHIQLDLDRGKLPIVERRRHLDSVLTRINKDSDNLAAENLLKTISAELHKTSGSSRLGISLIKKYLHSINIDTTQMVITDGSGLSFYNLLSPEIIVQLLQKQYESKKFFQRFFKTLPVAGIDGTLKNRMNNDYTKGRVFAKTGTLSGISTLSGYLKTLENEMLAFSIMCNHFTGEISKLRELQDRIVEKLVQLKWKQSD